MDGICVGMMILMYSDLYSGLYSDLYVTAIIPVIFYTRPAPQRARREAPLPTVVRRKRRSSASLAPALYRAWSRGEVSRSRSVV